ncbi:MAG: fibronectin/fibrinogen-binding protein [Clostridiaceae bacterium]|nr:fibronectin/fibrinogen-binding protein [Clostridiaceae bacterium]
MPLDGIVVNCLVHEFNSRILNGRIDKIYQPEKDELFIYIRSKGKNERLLLSASSNHPRAHFTEVSKPNPSTPPMFCMLLRKHLTGGKIVSISQPGLERIIHFAIETYNELGDLTEKTLIIEMMGRHSNIILIDKDGKIIDSIKHVGISTSSVRQVMPGLKYTMPPSQDKVNPLECTLDKIMEIMGNQAGGQKVDTYIVNHFTGISPLIGREICFRALGDSNVYLGELNDSQIALISQEAYKIFMQVINKQYSPVILTNPKDKKVVDFSVVNILQYPEYHIEHHSSISNVLDMFYSTRNHQERLKQKSSELLKIINTHLDRCKKKLNLQQKKMAEVSNHDELKTFGDLIISNIYRIEQGMDKIEVENFYEEGSPVVTIPLDPRLSPAKNAQKYFNEYTKAKNTAKMVSQQIKLNVDEINYLESLQDAVLKAQTEQEINEIWEEASEQGYVKRTTAKKPDKDISPSKPMHFVSSDGINIYVGKNNKQNDYLTLKFAQSNDLWLHVKNIPGSHTIIQTGGKDVPDSTLLEAAMLAAYYSKARFSSNVPVDYTHVKNVKKPSGAKPGMVIYENYKTIYVTPNEDLSLKLSK